MFLAHSLRPRGLRHTDKRAMDRNAAEFSCSFYARLEAPCSESLGGPAFIRFWGEAECRREQFFFIVLVLVLVGALPNWATASWGRGPSAMIGVVLIVVLILVLLGKL